MHGQPLGMCSGRWRWKLQGAHLGAWKSGCFKWPNGLSVHHMLSAWAALLENRARLMHGIYLQVLSADVETGAE